MIQRKGTQSTTTRRRVWRVSEAAPLGEFIYPDEVAAKNRSPREHQPDTGWRLSSMELTHGLEVTEAPADTVPGDIFDELFRR